MELFFRRVVFLWLLPRALDRFRACDNLSSAPVQCSVFVRFNSHNFSCRLAKRFSMGPYVLGDG